MITKANSGSPLVQPKLYRTVSMSSIMQAEQQDRFLQIGELNQLVSFLNSGNKRLEIANVLAQNANFLVSKAADKIFVGGSPISYLERPQASFLNIGSLNNSMIEKDIQGNTSTNVLDNLSGSLFNSDDSLPPGFKPISVVLYGAVRMKKSLRDLDWFLRYLTYSIIAGDTNILSVNIRGLRELIDNACSSAAAIVALREIRKLSISLFNDDEEAKNLVQDYFNVIIYEFESPSLSDKLRKRFSKDLQGLRLPQVYMNAGTSIQKFVMKSSLSANEKNLVIKACYRQIFERDISKAYNLKFTDLESQVTTGQLSIKEFVRFLAKSSVYRKQFYDGFVNSRVLELSFRHLLGRGPSSLNEFQKYFAVLSDRGLDGLIDTLINSEEYADYFGEETVPYLRSLGEEAQESRNWGAQIRLFNYSAVFRKIPEFITLFSDYKNSLPDQHPYGLANDPLAIQFGAIFPNNLVNLRSKSAFFGKDTRRILLRRGPGIYSQISNPNARKLIPGSLGPKVFDSVSINQKGVTDLNILTNAIYLKVFGRLLYEEELSTLVKFENQFKNNLFSVKQFIRILVKSNIFRALYWNSLYICKAIEYIHNKLIGRPTYGRQEINQYFDIAYKKGYYEMIDFMLDSAEYNESFGDNIVPYERYITSSTLSSRNLFTKIQKNNFKVIDNNNETISQINFISLGQIREKRSLSNIVKRINQGVSSKRDQSKLFIVTKNSSYENRMQILRAMYRQIFERDLNSFTIGDEFYNLEKAFLVGEITVQEAVEKLGFSFLYRKEFYSPYPNIKVIELGTKHFLGRAPNNQAEIRYYNQILASQGIIDFIACLVNSIEYKTVFGCNIVPYRRFPTLPAANFPNTEKLYNTLTKQNDDIIIPSFS
uniref:Phycobiliprotein ApcE n=1 Tax=Dipterocladia arabiensis TaxID=2007176 RepID=A0A1Z1M0W2_9FLOR|nr:phycobilisome linker polypeptide [Dipterocladia arabiensis]ARW59394.1 phycobilisome linker polypeptide [Dipterocladia arabiensis]